MKLDFGTAGIRGIIGEGENQLNNAHAARVFDGFARYLLSNIPNAQERGVVIGRDNRMKGKEFSHIAFKILTSYGIKVHFNNQMLATPFISFLTRKRKAAGAINITASHNPKEYNGIKIYNPNGSQLLPSDVKKLKNYFYEYNEYLKYLNFNFDIDEETRLKKDFVLPITDNDYDDYVNQVLKINFNQVDLSNINIVYSPLHGTGLPFIQRIFKKLNANVIYEAREKDEDPHFTFVNNPNPEKYEAFQNSIAVAKDTNAEIVLITDPDSDRVGVAIKDLTTNEFVTLNGNETAILITNYLIKNFKFQPNKQYYLVYSFVSTSLPSKMCLENNIKSYITETGFKWIGNKIDLLKNKEEFFFGFEESYGSLIIEDLAHDKDAIQATLALAIIASEAKKEKLNLLDKIDQIYQKYGYMKANSFSFDLSSQSQLETLKNKFKLLKLSNNLIDFNQGYQDIEPNDMLMFVFDDNLTWVSLRPSGTEPKVKLYIHVIDESKPKVEKKFLELFERTKKIFN